MSPNYFSEQYTECHKMIIDDLYLGDGMELSGDTIRRLADVTEKECYGIWIDVVGTYLPSMHDPEDFIVRCLNDIDYYKLKNEIEKMKSAIHKRDENIRLSTDDINYIFGLGKTRGAKCRQLYSNLINEVV